MKLAPLLAQFLYTHHRLELPGLGIFRLDPAVGGDPHSSKSEAAVDPSAISFESNTSIKESPELIQFISTQTGKLKALAAADLQSHLELIQQFLNIGKPFLLDGIGNLVKVKGGGLAFTSGQALPEALKDYSAREISSTSSVEESFSDYRKVINKPDGKIAWRRPVALLLILAGIGLAIWGGYTVYRSSVKHGEPVNSDTNQAAALINPEPVNAVQDTTTKKDSTPATTAPVTTAPVTTAPVTLQTSPISISGKMKYVLEQAHATRAFARFAKLKTFFWPVQMETRDSMSYTLYMMLPSSYADTTRIIDSLTTLNGKKVWVMR